MTTRLGRHAAALGLTLCLSWPAATPAAQLYFNGFETDNAGWNFLGGSFTATRVPTNTAGVPSADGAFHAQAAQANNSAVTNYGGYNFGAGGGVPTAFQEYTASLDIYLDVDGNWNNDTRFDYSNAINNAAGNFLRDFVFNAGFYDDTDLTGPGAGTDRFIFTASNNAGRANAFPKNPARDPFAISSTGWYTFQHHFYDNAGILNVDLSILDDGGGLLHTWTLGTAGTPDPTANTGGNRYGWIVNNEFSVLAIDNSSLATADAAAVPEPWSLALLGIGLLGLGAVRRRG